MTFQWECLLVGVFINYLGVGFDGSILLFQSEKTFQNAIVNGLTYCIPRAEKSNSFLNGGAGAPSESVLDHCTWGTMNYLVLYLIPLLVCVICF